MTLQKCLKCQEYDILLSELERLKAENTDLTEKLEDILSANQQLRDSNLLMQGKCETLLEDLSIKEARWTQREEQLKEEVRHKAQPDRSTCTPGKNTSREDLIVHQILVKKLAWQI